MKTNLDFGFDISAKGMSIQRKRMNVIAENIANADTTRTANGEPYKKKFIEVIQKENLASNTLNVEGQPLKLNISDANHFSSPETIQFTGTGNSADNLGMKELVDNAPGEMVYMPGNPDANEKGYVQMSNVNVVTEMVDMIAASRGFEANSTAFGATKQIAKDSLEI